MQEKTLSPDELAKIPFCNLVETIHIKWLQASGNKGGDLYVPSVDDYICAFLQVVAYYQYLKEGVGKLGPSKEELRLRCTQRRAEWTSDPGVLQKALFDMPGADEFCTCDPHHKGTKVFGSQKQKSDMLIGADNKTLWPDTINFSCPLLAKSITRARATFLPTILEERS